MTEQELRAIVREAIERHLHGGASGAAGPDAPRETAPAVRAVSHASHLMFVFAAEAAGDGRCLIEPVVACTHCGYCTSYGH